MSRRPTVTIVGTQPCTWSVSWDSTMKIIALNDGCEMMVFLPTFVHLFGQPDVLLIR